MKYILNLEYFSLNIIIQFAKFKQAIYIKVKKRQGLSFIAA
ncbi:hypothetical protein [Oceaniserpentilla sp. 4NH20-0058]